MGKKMIVLEASVELTVVGAFSDPVTNWTVKIDKDLPFSLWTELLDCLSQAVIEFDKEKFGGLYEKKGVQITPTMEWDVKN